MEFKNISAEVSRVNIGVEKLNKGEFSADFDWYTPPYLFSTENLSDSFDCFDFKNKNVLTVAASGDHMFDAYLRGAKNVDMFDLNLFQKYIIELKYLMIQNINYTKFMEFFFDKSNRMNIKILRKIEPKMSEPAKAFWDGFYNSPDKANFLHHLPFWNSHRCRRGGISYIKSHENYSELKKRLPNNFNFTWDNLDTIANTKNESKYNIIHLSNIFLGGLESLCAKAKLKEFHKNTITKLIKNKLSPNNGHIVFCYLWGTSFEDEKSFGLVVDFFDTFSSNKNTEYLYHEFSSAQINFDKDGILLINRGKNR